MVSLAEITEKFKVYLSVKHPKYGRRFSGLERTNPEGTRAVAVLFFLLKSQGFDVTIYKNFSTGGVNLLCKTSQDAFLVEVTCLEADTVAQHSGLKEETDSGWFGPITHLLRTKVSKKARQLSGNSMPRLLAITTEHMGGMGIQAAESLLTSDTGVQVQSWPSEPKIQTVTDLSDSVFFRFSRSGTIEISRQSISAILLVQVLPDECQIVGVLHPQPAFRFPIHLLPTVPFVQVRRWPPNEGRIETEWVIARPLPARFHYLAFENFATLPFFGMWADREDMKDSVAWVHRERRQWQQRVVRSGSFN